MISLQTIFIRLSLAIVLGSVVGLERGRTERRAGFRTYGLVCLGSCLFMIVSQFGFADVRGMPQTALDPSRVAAQVVSGIGFLGAGTIIFWREKVRGLTTAASVWATAAVGLAIGGGLYASALFATCGALMILSVFKPIEKKLSLRQQILSLTVDKKLVSLVTFESKLNDLGIFVDRIMIRPSDKSDEDLLELRLRRGAPQLTLQMTEDLRQVEGVLSLTASTKVTPGEGKPQDMETSDELSSDESYEEQGDQ